MDISSLKQGNTTQMMIGFISCHYVELNKIVKLTYELTDVYLCSMFHNIQAPKNSSRSNAGNRCKSVVLNSRQILSLPVMLFLFDDKQITFIMIHTQ